jgi:hypothetical protein
MGDIRTTLDLLYKPGDSICIAGTTPDGRMKQKIVNSIDDAERIITKADASGSYNNIYVNLQHLKPDAADVKRESFDRYTHFAVDIDRKSKMVNKVHVNATDEEVKHLKAVSDEVTRYLTRQLGQSPAVAFTGNGYHLIFRILGEYAASDLHMLTMKDCLRALKVKYDSDLVDIDISVAEPEQLVRCYGTWNRRSEDLPDRPQRQSKLVSVPNPWRPINTGGLDMLSCEAPAVKKSVTKAEMPTVVEDFDFEGWCEWYELEVGNPFTRNGKTLYPLAVCPMAGRKHHGTNEATCLTWDGEHLGWTCLNELECGDYRIGDVIRKLNETHDRYPYPIWPEQPLDTSKMPYEDVDALERAEEEAENDEVKPPINWIKLAGEMDEIRVGKTKIDTPKGEKTVAKPRHVVDEEVYQYVLDRVIGRYGKMYVDAYPYVFIEREGKLINWKNDNEAYELMSRLHLRLVQRDSQMVRENLDLNILMYGEHTRIEKYGCLRDNTLYINNGRGGMFRLTAGGDVDEVPNGTDGVLVLANAVTPWPTIKGNEERIKEIAEKLSYKGGKVSKESALCRHFSGMFEEDILSSEQYQQMIMLRYLSLFMGNVIPIRPILMSLGEQGSGKSTLWEKIMWLLQDIDYESGALPQNLRSFVASLTNSQMQIYDNIDGTNFSKGDPASYIDLMCKASTGGKIPIAELYKTNIVQEYSLRCDLFLTARVNPFPSHRSDLSRRMLYFPVRKPEADEYVTVKRMKADLKADADEMRLETLVRLQAVLEALVNNQQEYVPISEMHDYENWTRRIAEYEGWGAEMVAIWKGCKEQYQERVSEDSPMVDSIRRWIGSQPEHNVSRWVRASEIYKELLELYPKQTSGAWRSSASFGKALKANFSALRILGIVDKKVTGHCLYYFQPASTQIEFCSLSYEDSVPDWRLQSDAEDVKLKNLDDYVM